MEKNLKNLLKDISYSVLNGDVKDTIINKLCYDTREVEKGDIFICLKGARFDSHTAVTDVVNYGASVIVVEKGNEEIKKALIDKSIILIEVPDTRHALAIISKNYFCNPTKDLRIIGVTGTKGKTTTSFMIKKILEDDGIKVGMIGTIGIFYGDNFVETSNTTPESYILYETFYKMKESGVSYVVMEVSSQSLKWHRVDGIRFYYVVWTNIMPEHIGKDEHTDFNDYFTSKLKIFSMCDNALIDSNTEYIDDIIETCKKHNVFISIKSVDKDLKLMIPGDYNIDNASLAYKMGVLLGINESIIKYAVEHTLVPGRCELVYDDNNIKVYVDYSYEPSGAEKFLKTIIPLKENGRIVCIFGCGGNRSKDRRYGMGKVSGKFSDFVILTSDNSRWEKTIDIIHDIESTLKEYKKKDDVDNGYIVIEDRKEAIEYAIKNRRPYDVICVMGKGHEATSESMGIRTRFLDKEEVLNAVKKYI